MGNINLKKLGVDGFVGESSNPFGGQNVSFEITNQGTSAEARLLAVSKGWYDNASEMRDFQGNTPAAVIADGQFITTSNKEVTGTGKSCRIIDVVNLFTKSVCRIKGIKLSVDDASQLDEEIQIVKLTPQGPQILKRVTPSSSKSEDQTDDKRVSIDLSDDMVVMGSDVAMFINVGAGRKVTYTIFYEKVASYRALVENNAFEN